MEEQIGFHPNNRSIMVSLRHVLLLFTVPGNELKLTSSMDIEYLASEDEFNYIEYEYDENPIVNTVNKAFNHYKIKLYLQENVDKLLENFKQGINTNITLEGYLIEIRNAESILEEVLRVTAKKQLI